MSQEPRAPAVSIILAVYNGAATVARCLDDLLGQTYPALDLIVVDDGSIDATPQILSRYAAAWPERIRLLRQANGGAGAARAAGLGLAGGVYVTFLDGDDRTEPDLIARLVERAESTQADLTVCWFDRIDAASGKVLDVEMRHFGDEILEGARLIELAPLINTSHWNKLYRRAAIEAIPYPPLRRSADLIYYLHILPQLRRIAFVPRVLIHYQVQVGSIISTVREQAALDLVEAFRETSGRYQALAPAWREAFAYIAFIHLAVSLLYRIAYQPELDQQQWRHLVLGELDRFAPGWRRIRPFGWRWALRHGSRAVALRIVRDLHRLGLFGLFVRAYRLLIDRFKVDVKW
jgi:glycosyltransferase involved in cell wall biosynthesis